MTRPYSVDHTVTHSAVLPVTSAVDREDTYSGEHIVENMIILEQNLFIVYTQVSVFPN